MVTAVLVVAFIALVLAVGRRAARRSRSNGAPDQRWYPDQDGGQTQGPSGHHGGHHGDFSGGHDHGGGFSGGHDHGGGGFSGGGHH
jgi:hypothetical protein